jgi:hypothetical protein
MTSGGSFPAARRGPGRPPSRRARSGGRGPSGGQGLVEYGLIIGLSAALAVLILVAFGDQVADLVQWIAELVEGGP